MFKSLYNLLKTVIELAEDAKRHRAELVEIRKDLRDLTLVVIQLAQELKATREDSERRRAEVLALIDKRLSDDEGATGRGE